MRVSLHKRAAALACVLAAALLAGCGAQPAVSGGADSLPAADESAAGGVNTSAWEDTSFSEGTAPAQTTGSSGSTGAASTTRGTAATVAPSADVGADYYIHSAGKVFQNMRITLADTGKTGALSGQYGLLELGRLQLEDYPIDGVYDQAFNVIKVGDVYKMWWCRACPWDTIWYAESKDMKNWYNARCVLDVKDMRTTYLKAMMSWPSVLYIDGTYHMFFEAPAELAASGEYSNNILYATSKDGINWTFFPNNKNPQPVIVNPNVREGVYGVGQPKAFYKDGYFYVVYTDATSGGGDIRVARSKGNGYSFEGTVASHTKLISGVAGAAVRYNQATDSYFLLFSASETQKDGTYTDNLYMMESKDLFDWPCKTRAQALLKVTRLSDTAQLTKKGNPDFVTDGNGIVPSENMLFVHMEGAMPSASEDHRATHTTWDGYLGIISAGTAFGKTAVLPNGRAASDDNLKWYRDRVAVWQRPTVTAGSGSPKIDGTVEAVYGEAALVESVTWYGSDSKPTDTAGSVRFAWDSDSLYVYAQVQDATPFSRQTDDLWRSDGVAVYIDVPNIDAGKNTDAAATASGYRVQLTADGQWSVYNGADEDISARFGGLETSVTRIAGGYAVEAKIPWYSAVKGQIRQGKAIGLDVRIFDHFGTDAARMAQVFWSDYTAQSSSNLARYGQLTLK